MAPGLISWILLHTNSSANQAESIEVIYAKYLENSREDGVSLDIFARCLKNIYRHSSLSGYEYVCSKPVDWPESIGSLKYCSGHRLDGVPFTKELRFDSGKVLLDVNSKDICLEPCGIPMRYSSLEDICNVIEGVKLLHPCMGYPSLDGHIWTNPDGTRRLTKLSNHCSVVLPLDSSSTICSQCVSEQKSKCMTTVEQISSLLKCLPLSDSVEEFIQEQILHSVKKLSKWQPEILALCSLLHYNNPDVYKQWRKALFLPHPKSLKSGESDSIENTLKSDSRSGLKLQIHSALVDELRLDRHHVSSSILSSINDSTAGSHVEIERDKDFYSILLKGDINDIIIPNNEGWECKIGMGKGQSEIIGSTPVKKQKGNKRRKRATGAVVAFEEASEEYEDEDEDEDEIDCSTPHKVSCALCGHECMQKGALASHVRWVHRLQWNAYCLVIKAHTDNEERKKHLQSLVALNDRVQLPCPACKAIFPTVTELHKHIKKEHDTATRKKPEFCQKLEEIEAAASIEGFGYKVECPYCSRKRSGLSSVKKHLNVWHSDEEGFADKKNSFIEEFKQRLKKGPLECWRCGHICTGFHNLAYHVRCKCLDNPNRTKYLHCNKCRSKFSTREALQQHIKERHKDGRKEYQCDQCGKNYATAPGLLQHRRSIHEIADKKPIKLYTCEVCSKSFYKRSHYNVHMESHSTKKSVNCEICGKLLKSDRSLQQHKIHMHQNQYPYQCNRCGHGLRKKKLLESHKCHRVHRISNISPPEIIEEVDLEPSQLESSPLRKSTETSSTLEASAFAELESYLMPPDRLDSERFGVSPSGGSLLQYTLDSQMLNSVFPSTQTSDVLNVPVSGPSQLMEEDLPPDALG